MTICRKMKKTHLLNFPFKMEIHRRRHRISNCDSCDKIMPLTTKNLHSCVIEHQDILRCDHCEFETKRKGHLKRHKESVHNKSCKDCSSVFPSERELKLHIESEHEPRCSWCDKTFNRKSDLKDHRRRKSCLKQYQCQSCDFTASTKSQLKFHSRVDHVAKKKKRFKKSMKCSHCMKDFKNHYSNLKRHEATCPKKTIEISDVDAKKLIDKISKIRIPDTAKVEMLTVIKQEYGILNRVNIRKAVRDSSMSLENAFTCEKMTFEMKDKSGKSKGILSAAAYVKNLPSFVNKLCLGRNISSPRLGYYVDGGQRKVLGKNIIESFQMFVNVSCEIKVFSIKYFQDP